MANYMFPKKLTSNYTIINVLSQKINGQLMAINGDIKVISGN